MSEWTDTVERDDGMDDKSYHTREVYAYFGLAIYHAQVLEHGVVNLLTIAKIFPDPTAAREMFELVMDQYFGKVFGKLVKEVTPYLGDDVELLTDLKYAVAVRNHLVHRCWREEVGLALTARGKNRMIAELRDTVQMFVDIDGRLDHVMLKHAGIRGATMDDIRRSAEKQKLEWLALDGFMPGEVHDLSANERDRWRIRSEILDV